MRRAFAIATTVMNAVIGTMAIALPLRWFWFRASLGVLLYGHALRWLALDDAFASFRQLIGLSVTSGMRLWFGSYALAGILAFAGAVASLRGALAVVVGISALIWTALWLRVLRRVKVDGG